jgi:hypothetical protein
MPSFYLTRQSQDLQKLKNCQTHVLFLPHVETHIFFYQNCVQTPNDLKRKLIAVNSDALMPLKKKIYGYIWVRFGYIQNIL